MQTRVSEEVRQRPKDTLEEMYLEFFRWGKIMTRWLRASSLLTHVEVGIIWWRNSKVDAYELVQMNSRPWAYWRVFSTFLLLVSLSALIVELVPLLFMISQDCLISSRVGLFWSGWKSPAKQLERMLQPTVLHWISSSLSPEYGGLDKRVSLWDPQTYVLLKCASICNSGWVTDW